MPLSEKQGVGSSILPLATKKISMLNLIVNIYRNKKFSKTLSDNFTEIVNVVKILFQDSDWVIPVEGPFGNMDKKRQEIIQNIITDFKPKLIVETGTLIGNTTEFFAQFSFAKVVSYEVSKLFFLIARNRLFKYKNCELILKDSSEGILSNTNFSEKTFFYLDAHGYDFKLPIENEINHIKNFDNFVILIDDFKVDTNPEWSFDIYKGFELSLDNLNIDFNNLNIYFPNYDSSLDGRQRGFVIITNEVSLDSRYLVKFQKKS